MPLSTIVQRKYRNDSFRKVLQTAGANCEHLEIDRVYIDPREIDSIHFSRLFDNNCANNSKNNKTFFYLVWTKLFFKNNNFSPFKFTVNYFRAYLFNTLRNSNMKNMEIKFRKKLLHNLKLHFLNLLTCCIYFC